MMNDRRSVPTWKWVAGICLTIIFALGTSISGIASYSYIDTQEKIAKLDKEKVDTQVFLMLYDEVKLLRISLKEDQRETHKLLREGNKMLFSHIDESGKGKLPNHRDY